MRVVGLTFPEEKKEKFKCPECGKEYASKAALEKHIIEKHSPESGGDE